MYMYVYNIPLCHKGSHNIWYGILVWVSEYSGISFIVYNTTHFKRRLESWWLWVQVPPKAANFSLKNDCFGRVVLCCLAFLLFVVVVALPFSAFLFHANGRWPLYSNRPIYSIQ